MKSAILLLISATQAVQLQDGPASFNKPTWNENMPSAAGLLEVSACVKAGKVGDVSCGPTNIELFATGMNGDEDLAQDITMKGEKFHYAQGEPAPVAAAEGDAAAAGEAAPLPEKVSVLDGNGTWRVAKGHTTFYGQGN